MGLNFFHTSPFDVGPNSEIELEKAISKLTVSDRRALTVSTSVGRYAETNFDFSKKRVQASVRESMSRIGTDHLDLVIVRDFEFARDHRQIVEEAIPALWELL